MSALVSIALIVLPALTLAGAGTVVVDGVQDGRPLVLTPEDQEKIGRLALELLTTASYEADQAIATEQRWQEARRHSRLHLRFTPTRTVTFRFSTIGPAAAQQVQVDEMLMAIARGQWPDYILIRERGTVRAFAKYRPQQAQALRDALDAGAKAR